MREPLTPIYLDYAATTPLDPRVLVKMQASLAESFANPSSLHVEGRRVSELVEGARAHVADVIGAEPSEIIWTSGATESINLALKGVVQGYAHRGRHIVTMQTEHRAVLSVCQHLEKAGYPVTFLPPTRDGLLDLDQFKASLTPETVLVSIMHVNNETGVIQDIQSIAEITRERGILLHVDAAQSMGKVPLDMQKTPIDLLSLSAHKAYGPKGIGALFLRKKPRVRVAPLLHGGGHEQGLRSGTLATHQIVGMGEAFRLAMLEREADWQHAVRLRDQLIVGLKDKAMVIPAGSLQRVVPHIVNVLFTHKIADALLKALPQLALSTASACQGMHTDGSYVLRAMGFSEQDVKSAIRFSFGRFTEIGAMEAAIAAIRQVC
jgi:cysteine desulfurase